MSIFIRGTQKQLERFAEEAGLSKPMEDKSIQINLNLLARDNDTMMHTFSRVFDRSIYTPPRNPCMKKVDLELSSIYRTLLVKCGA